MLRRMKIVANPNASNTPCKVEERRKVGCSCGRDSDELRIRGSFGYGQAVFDQAGDVQRNALNNELMRLLASIADYTKTREIGNVSSPSSVLCALVDDGIFTHGFILDLPAGECSSKCLLERPCCLFPRRWYDRAWWDV